MNQEKVSPHQRIAVLSVGQARGTVHMEQLEQLLPQLQLERVLRIRMRSDEHFRDDPPQKNPVLGGRDVLSEGLKNMLIDILGDSSCRTVSPRRSETLRPPC